jgi:hypothetical protein
MPTQVTVSLPDDLYWQAEHLAQATGRAVADLLVETIQLSLPPRSAPAEAVTPLGALSDDAVLALADLQLESAADRRLSALLDRQQAGTLSGAERSELLALMQLYQDGLLRKAQALEDFDLAELGISLEGDGTVCACDARCTR